MRAGWLGIVLAAAMACGCSRVTDEDDRATPEPDGGGSRGGGGDTDGDSAESYSENCRGAGHYESGKEGSYLPCCDGPEEVSQRNAQHTPAGVTLYCCPCQL